VDVLIDSAGVAVAAFVATRRRNPAGGEEAEPYSQPRSVA
jgi:hypothetical protein